MRPGRRSLRWPGTMVAAAVLVAPLLGGCASHTPQPAYTPPPRALTITAQRKQSQARQDRDKADCQAIATGQATSSDAWAQMFAACMGGRGYMVH